MIQKSLVALGATLLLAAFSGTVAQAATTPAPSIAMSCTKAGATSMIAGKSYTCVKVLSGKLIWAATSTSTTVGGAKPQIAGGRSGEGEAPEGGPSQIGEGHSSRGATHQTTLKKYNSCLASHGGVGQAKAIAACTALAPKLPTHEDN